MTPSAWQRLAPATGDGPGRDLDAVVDGIEAYLAESDTVGALDAAEADGAYPRAVLTGLRARLMAELLVPDRATSPHIGALNVVTARHGGSLAITVGVNALALLPVYLGGSDEQCSEVTRRLRAGHAAALLLTELEHGSNLTRIESGARPDRDGYRLTGEKHLINGGTEHELLVTLMRTRRSPAERQMAALRDLSLFLVERDASTPALPRWRTLPAHAADISGVRFDTWVPRGAMIGREGDGFALVQKTLRISHAGIGALASGAVSGALDLTLDHARTRDIYGGPIVGLGAIADHCVRMAALDVVVAAMAVKAAWLANQFGSAAGYFAAAAKFACCRLAEEAVGEGRQVLGARALLEDLPYARFVRDVLLYGVFDGTSHLMLDDLSWYLSRSATTGLKRGTLDTLRSVYAAPPRSIRSTASQPWRPYAPALSARCADLVEATGDPAAQRLADLATTLTTVVRAARSAGTWDTDQSFRFRATAVLAELEALLAAVELTSTAARKLFGLAPVDEPDADAARFAVSWLGDRLAARLRQLADDAPGGTGPDASVRDRLRAFVAAAPNRTQRSSADRSAGQQTGDD
jgi:alkylation response protein AidB-like acyl-CoA dehydrogenase